MLIVKEDGPVLHVSLNRPEARNAFNDELIAALTDVFQNRAKSFRASVLSGEGTGFCAGGDLQWMQKAALYTREENIEDALKLASLFQAITDCPGLVIAKVHGAVFGGGCGLVAASDVCVASTDTVFAFSEVRLGLVPATISPLVIAKIGHGNARSLFTTGESFTADRALRIGLIHECVAESALNEVVESKLKAVLAAGPGAVAASKRLAQQSPLSAQASAELLADARAGEEAVEGISAFLAKRTASYKVDR